MTSNPDPSIRAAGALCAIAYVILWIIGAFNLKASIEEHFNVAEPFSLQLSAVMTFFFNVFYFQYHFSRIVEIKRRQGQVI